MQNVRAVPYLGIRISNEDQKNASDLVRRAERGERVTITVLDTSVLIANDLQPLPGELAISVASLAELHYGVLAATTADARAHQAILYTRNAADLEGIEDLIDIVAI